MSIIKQANSNFEGYDNNNDAHYMTLLDTKVADLSLSATTLKTLKEADVITLRDFIALPEKYDDITLLDDDGNPYVIVKGEKFYIPKGTFDDFLSEECPFKAEDFDAEGILTLIGIKRFVRKR
jgi:hypothetical protein